MTAPQTIYEVSKARQFLSYANHGVQKLITEKPTGNEWVLTWVATLTVLRAVGHILIHETAGTELEEIQQEIFKEVKHSASKNNIFFDFIKRQRDKLLKEGDLGAGQGVRVSLETTEILYPVYGGPFDGRDQRDVIQEAIEWWQWYVDELETRAGAKAIARGLDTKLE